MKNRNILAALLAAGLASVAATAAAEPGEIARGRYLVAIGGCNDCHTPGYAQTDGQTPEAERLTGGNVGFSGPWGVSYPANLRLAAQMDGAHWLKTARGPGRPPMPWPSLRAMTDRDLLAIRTYLRSLGPAGVAAPAALPPGAPITTPHISFVPQSPIAVGARQ